ncbi:carbamoyl phosphate synthase small subunit [Lederbergia lenta]|uniref:carbamoyl phosphate synthase small subunit n=1 Tax=Lederbergia lenta TaxID=1467 RepID=UPI00203C488E|nr:carbamoyl phosphate synthase small subunit [Lederbergia lenta]MCM3109690.1 carbamoyl phosphate synthase small subunit [Lederbergia lenta]
MQGSLKLATGEIFNGDWYGEINESYGEVIHYTGMGNFLEFLTDPAVKGKIVLSTYPGILNSSTDTNKFESDHIQAVGVITQQTLPLNNIDNHTIAGLCMQQNIPVLTNTDTRAIMKRLRAGGEMPAKMVANEQLKVVDPTPSTPIAVNTNKKMNQSGSKHMVIIDFGVKKSLINWLIAENYKLTIVAPEMPANEIVALDPDGVIFSGGPGNPEVWKQNHSEYRKIAEKYPTIGFGLGHQILASTFGATVEKLARGHRSFKQPIIHTATNQVFLSVQNHGYAVDEQSLKDTGFSISFKSIQDGTVDGLVHDQYQIVTYQFHPNGKNVKLETMMLHSFFHQLDQQKGVKLYA